MKQIVIVLIILFLITPNVLSATYFKKDDYTAQETTIVPEKIITRDYNKTQYEAKIAQLELEKAAAQQRITDLQKQIDDMKKITLKQDPKLL